MAPMRNAFHKPNAAAVPAPGGVVDLHGVLNVKKDTNWTSHDVVARLRGTLGVPRIGHAGTLDPAATGVLPILIGKATKIAEYLVSWEKEYRAVLRLGEVTDTQDATGVVVTRHSADRISSEAIHEAVVRFQGRIRQVPPMYSAVKVKGKPLYKAARAGRTVAREAREVEIRRIEVLAVEGPDVWLRVVCSKGTFIRTLCADIGEALGVGGHVRELERLRVGPLRLEHALSLDQVRDRYAEDGLATDLISLDQALENLPAVEIDRAAAGRVLHGAPVPLPAVGYATEHAREALEAGRVVRIKDSAGRLLALGALRSVGLMDDQGRPALAIVKMLVAA